MDDSVTRLWFVGICLSIECNYELDRVNNGPGCSVDSDYRAGRLCDLAVRAYVERSDA